MASRILRRQRTQDKPPEEQLDVLASTHRNMSFDLAFTTEGTAPPAEEGSANPQRSDLEYDTGVEGGGGSSLVVCGPSSSEEEVDSERAGKTSEQGTAATASLADSSLQSSSISSVQASVTIDASTPPVTSPPPCEEKSGPSRSSRSRIAPGPPSSSNCSRRSGSGSGSGCGGGRLLRSSLKADRMSLEQSVHSVGLSHHGGRNRARFAAAGADDDSSSKDGTACTTRLDKSVDASSLGVSFHSVEVREYGRQLGDNPSVSYGPPISIGWNYDESTRISVPLEEYEEIRKPERRCERELVLPRSVRENLVRESGFSRNEIASAVRQVERDKRSRRRTVHNLKLMKFDESLETAGRKLKRAVLGKKKDKALLDEWARQKAMAEAMIREENEASAALNVDGDEAGESAKAAELSPDEEQALWDTVSTKAKGTTRSLLTRRLPGNKARAIVIEEDSTHRGTRYSRATRANAA